MRRFRLIMSIAFCITVALFLAMPLGLYWLGLSGVEGLPQKPQQLVTKEQEAIVWRRAGGVGEPRIDKMNPYSYVVALVVGKEEPRTTPGQRIAWWVASDYLSSHRRHRGMEWWHLSGAALMIWVSRNWTSEEILSAATPSSTGPSQHH